MCCLYLAVDRKRDTDKFSFLKNSFSNSLSSTLFLSKDINCSKTNMNILRGSSLCAFQCGLKTIRRL